jgi:cyclopropane fatty-acyl-phospholipid synthase-like methyltransferase
LPNWWDLAYRSGAPWDSGVPADELMELVQGGRVRVGRALDIGCGTGTNVLYLAEKGFDVTGVDISKVAVRKAAAKARERDLKCSFYVMNFLDTEAVSRIFSTFDVVLDAGCFHSLSAQDRLRYKGSLKVISRAGSMYLLWCFLRGSRWSYGPRGVDQDEAERTLSNEFRVVEKRRLNISFREMLFYIMYRHADPSYPQES